MNKRDSIKTKQKILEAFQVSKNISISEVCRIVGINRSTFYFHLKKDGEFCKRVLQDKQQQLEKEISLIE
jgi:AcrR family transcriptional regulator